MKFLAPVVLGAIASTGALAAAVPKPQQEPLIDLPIHYEQERYLVELAPGKTRWVTEEEKWSLKLVRISAFRWLRSCSVSVIIFS